MHLFVEQLPVTLQLGADSGQIFSTVIGKIRPQWQLIGTTTHKAARLAKKSHSGILVTKSVIIERITVNRKEVDLHLKGLEQEKMVEITWEKEAKKDINLTWIYYVLFAGMAYFALRVLLVMGAGYLSYFVW
jgi:hypothetical protein